MTAQARTGTAPEALRDLAEKSAAQAKQNLDTMSAAAGEATDLLKHGYATTVKGTQDYGTKVLEFTNANIKAAVEHATKLMTAKSPMEFFALSNDYGKRQFEIITRQAQELAAIVQTMTIAKDR
jgi:phasin